MKKYQETDPELKEKEHSLPKLFIKYESLYVGKKNPQIDLKSEMLTMTRYKTQLIKLGFLFS